MKSIKQLVTTILFCAIATVSLSQTYVSGTIFVDEVWTKENSPYIISSGYVGIYDDASLTIKKGVTIKSSKGNGISAKGSLIVEGTEEEPVIFTSTEGTERGSWGGISLDPQKENSSIKFNHVVIEYANIAVSSNGQNQISKFFKNCTFSTCYTALAQVENVTIDSCKFTYGRVKEVIRRGSGVIKNSIFHDNMSPVIFAFSGTINNCEIYDSGDAITIEYESVLVTNCSIYNNSVGLNVRYNDAVVENNKIYQNSTGILLNDNTTNNKIKNNFICNNTGYNIKSSLSTDYNISGNCYCLTDSAEIQSKIYDKHQNVGVGFVTFSPYNICELSDPIEDSEPSLYSIQGTVLAGSEKILDGIVLLYKEGEVFPISYTSISQGSYNFKDIDKGLYKVYAVPGPSVSENFIPTYYVNKIHFAEAPDIVVGGHVQSVDILLQETPASTGIVLYSGTISYYNSVNNQSPYQHNWFPHSSSNSPEYNSPKNLVVLLHDKNSEIIDWTLTNEYGEFEFNIPSLDCYISVERNGYKLLGNGNLSTRSHTIDQKVTGINHQASSKAVKVFPNPATNRVILDIPEVFGGISVEILSTKGEVLLSQKEYSSNSELDISRLPAGFYIFRINTNDNIYISNFQKQ